MKRLISLLGVAFLTFSVGVTLTIYRPRIFQPSPPESNPGEHIRLKLQRLERLESRYEMRFHIFNGSSEPLRYQGYRKDDHCAFVIRRDNGAERRVSCFCGTGLAERVLHPGETATFPIGLGQGFGKVKVGFDFLIGTSGRKLVVWSEDISLP